MNELCSCQIRKRAEGRFNEAKEINMGRWKKDMEKMSKRNVKLGNSYQRRWNEAEKCMTKNYIRGITVWGLRSVLRSE